MIAFIHVLLLSILSLAHVVQPQAQPCLICGDSVLRIWSMMSRQGDRYLRITNNGDSNNNNHKIIDCGGRLESDNFTSLLKIRERPTFDETRIQLVLQRDNSQYHLYATSAAGAILAMPASEGEQQTDHRNTWAPERLLYEHRLFTVFQSVKFRGFYLSCDGSGKAALQQIINKAYREPNQLFLTIDPGNAIRGVTFGAGNTVGRRKREISQAEEDANPLRGKLRLRKRRRRRQRSRRYIRAKRIRQGRVGRYRFRKTHRRNHYQIYTPRPKAYHYTTTEKPTTQPPPQYSSVVTNFDLPLNITFVVCFWIKTEAKFSQLISVTEETLEEKIEEKVWRRYTYPRPTRKTTVTKRNNIVNVAIFRGFLKLEVGYKRTSRTLSNCSVSDGKFHHICISLNHDHLLEVYRDSKVVLRDSLPDVASDFQNKKNRTNRRGIFMLGRKRGMGGGQFDGSLFQVNMWDQYPSFRITRIATNCACGGGTLVSWQRLLNGTMSAVNIDNNSECPKLEGYNYDELTQSKLI